MTTEEIQQVFNDAIMRYERGELSKADVLRIIVAIGPEVGRVCRDFGDTSERCINMKNTIEQIARLAQDLPDRTPSNYGLGTVVVAGLGGAVLGGLVTYFVGKK